MRLYAIALALVFVAATHAAAQASVPVGAEVRVDRAIDLKTFTQTVSRQYAVTVRRAVAADIDRDGDLDVITATDREFLVWINDGHGVLTSQRPDRGPVVDGGAPADSWRPYGPDRQETIQSDPPSPKTAAASAHAPPRIAVSRAWSSRPARYAAVVRGASVPRAPPL